MSRALPAPPLLVITDRLSAPLDLSHIVTEVLDAGARWLMVREKDLDGDALARLAGEIAGLARPYRACVTVNGDPRAALAAGAAGVHVQTAGQVAGARDRLGDDALIGVSAHSPEEARGAAAAGADYVTLSPIFLTDSKPGYGPALGTGLLAAVCADLAIPVVALAGVSPGNAASCLDAGAAAVAVMGTIMRSETPGAAVRDYLRAMESGAPTP